MGKYPTTNGNQLRVLKTHQHICFHLLAISSAITLVMINSFD